MFQVTIHYHGKDYRNGDLEDRFELIATVNFKTRTEAKDFIWKDLSCRKGTKSTDWHKGDRPSYAYCFTGVTWQHENTGEQMEEYYQYTLKKVKLR